MAENVKRHNQLPYESDFYDKPSFLEMRAQFGWEGVAFIFALSGQMWRRTDSQIAYDELSALAYGWRIEPKERLLEVVRFAIKVGLFEDCSIAEAQLELGLSAAQANSSIHKSSQVSRSSQVRQEEPARPSFHCPFVTRAASDYSARVESLRAAGKLGGRSSADQKAVTFPTALDTPECRDAWADLLEHKKDLGERYKSDKSQQAKLTELSAMGPERFCAAVMHSRGNNYAGIYEPKSGNGAGARSKPTTWELNQAKLKEAAAYHE
jgi:hypothetical protein